MERTAADLNVSMEAEAVSALVDAIGNDSARLSMEIQKLALHAESHGRERISAEAVLSLIEGQATNALAVGDALLEGDAGGAIGLLDALIDAGEPALRIVPLSLDKSVAGFGCCCWNNRESVMWP